MSENLEMPSQIIEIEDEEGKVKKAELLDIIEMDEKEYALLYPIDEDNSNDDQEAIVMRLVEDGDSDYFERIEDDEEFEKISNYIMEIQEEN